VPRVPRAEQASAQRDLQPGVAEKDDVGVLEGDGAGVGVDLIPQQVRPEDRQALLGVQALLPFDPGLAVLGRGALALSLEHLPWLGLLRLRLAVGRHHEGRCRREQDDWVPDRDGHQTTSEVWRRGKRTLTLILVTSCAPGNVRLCPVVY
jgi:hypothetical protein